MLLVSLLNMPRYLSCWPLFLNQIVLYLSVTFLSY